jgi:hypothetical protein
MVVVVAARLRRLASLYIQPVGIDFKKSISGLIRSLENPSVLFFIEPEVVNFLGAPKSIPRNGFLDSLDV